MKKITFMFFALCCFAYTWQGYAQSVATQQFYATGSDASGFQLSIDDSDITANLGQPIQEITILDYRAHYSSTTGTQSCDFDYGWFYFDLTVTGGVANGLSIDEGCD